jgi:hypothetical protein
VANVTLRCAPGVTTAVLNVTLGTDSIFNLPTHRFDSPPTQVKEAVQGDGYRHPLLLPCADNLITYNAERAFTVASDGHSLRVDFSSLLDGLVDRGVPFCLSLPSPNASPTTAPCGTTGGVDFSLVDNRVTAVDMHGVKLCLAARLSNQTNATCPPNSFYTDPSAAGACQSSLFTIVAEMCDDTSTAQTWTLDKATRHLKSNAITGRCLAAVPRTRNNKVAVAVAVQGKRVNGTTTTTTTTSEESSSSAARASLSSSSLWQLTCGATVSVTVAVVSERDVVAAASRETTTTTTTTTTTRSSSTTASLTPVQMAQVAQAEATRLQTDPARTAAMADHASWWSEYWAQTTTMVAPAWPDLERFYRVMMYLQRSSMRAGKVAPGLWGPFSTTDFPGWSDQFTLDYNFM